MEINLLWMQIVGKIVGQIFDNFYFARSGFVDGGEERVVKSGGRRSSWRCRLQQFGSCRCILQFCHGEDQCFVTIILLLGNYNPDQSVIMEANGRVWDSKWRSESLQWGQEGLTFHLSTCDGRQHQNRSSVRHRPLLCKSAKGGQEFSETSSLLCKSAKGARSSVRHRPLLRKSAKGGQEFSD